MLHITIPTPCQQDWETMTPNSSGRHCSACSKTVIDFTAMNDEALRNFFILKKDEKICGRFKNGQLHRTEIVLPANIFSVAMPLWKRFLVAGLFAFGATLFSCNTSLSGKVAIEKGSFNDSLATTTIWPPPVGSIAAQMDSSRPKVNFTCATTTGDIAMVIVEKPAVTTGVILPEIKPTDSLKEIIVGKIIEEGSGLIQPAKEILYPDSLQTKKPPKADSVNCDTLLYL